MGFARQGSNAGLQEEDLSGLQIIPKHWRMSGALKKGRGAVDRLALCMFVGVCSCRSDMCTSVCGSWKSIYFIAICLVFFL